MRAKALPLLFVLAVSACRGPSATTETAAPNATSTGGVLYEGATLIAGDGSAPVERAAFTVQDGKSLRWGGKAS